MRLNWFEHVRCSRLCQLTVIVTLALCFRDYQQRFALPNNISGEAVDLSLAAPQASQAATVAAKMKALWPYMVGPVDSAETQAKQPENDYRTQTVDGTTYRLVAVFLNVDTRQWFARLRQLSPESNSKVLMLAAGDQLGDFVVTSIGENTIVFKNDTEQFSLHIFKPLTRDEAPQ